MPIILPPPRLNIKFLPKGKNRKLSQRLLNSCASPLMSGTLYPSGRFSFGFVPPKQKSLRDREHELSSQDWECLRSEHYNSEQGTVHKYQWVNRKPPRPRFIDGHYLGKTRARRGTKGLTRHGKKFVRESCFLLEKLKGIKNLGFYTFTLPSMSSEEALEVATKWAEIRKYLFRLIRKEYEKANEKFFCIGVVENQAERTSRYGYPSYHIHAIFPCYRVRSKEFVVRAERLRALWRRAISNYVPSFSDRDYGASVDAQILRKSAAGYLSKYFSKGSALDAIPQHLLPSSWYFSSLETRRFYKLNLRHLYSQDCLFILQTLRDKELVSYWDYVFSPGKGEAQDVLRGYIGVLRNPPDIIPFL